jgi:predicted DNA-binding transcriptional regulator AlpA
MEEIIERLERIELTLAGHGAYLDTKQASALTGIAAATLECWRRDGVGPPYVKLGRLVKYRRVDLDDFMDGHLVNLP